MSDKPSRLNSNNITNKPRTLKDLAEFYSVDIRTMRSWLDCPQLKHILDNKIGNYFSIAQIREIIAHLDTP